MPIIGQPTCWVCGDITSTNLIGGSSRCTAHLCPRTADDMTRLREHIEKLNKELAAWREFAPLAAFDGNVIVMPG